MIRDAFARYAAGVAVVSVRDGAGYRGISVSSLAAVSVEPPLLLFCLDAASQALELVVREGRIAVSLLPREQEFLADRFAARAPLVDRAWPDVAHAPAPSGLPVIVGALAWFDCRVADRHHAGDHDIVLAAVEAHGLGPSGDPLVLFDRGYWTVG